MKKIKNIEEFIKNSKRMFDFGDNYRYSGIQLNVEDNNTENIIDFLKFCQPLAVYFFIDALGGPKTSSDMRRETIDDRSFDDVIEQINHKDSFAFSGMKIFHKSSFSISPWEKWENGYIEIFLRTNAKTDTDYNELFIWMYIRIEHLEVILDNAKEYIRYFESDIIK